MKTVNSLAAVAGVAAAQAYGTPASYSSSSIPTGVPSAETCTCYLELTECQGRPDANEAFCASQFSGCPYTGDAATTAYFDNLEKYCTPLSSYAPAYSATSSCPAPGSTNAQGGYSCNPAHQYPEGQTCNLSNGCYILTTVSVDTPVYTPVTYASASSYIPAYPSASAASCPAPGTTGSQGYSCNPAHQYPAGQQCNLSDGCYILTTVYVDNPVYTPAPRGLPSSYAPAQPSVPASSASCPAPGTTGSQGYSCNPAHQYPSGQQCKLSNGCYILTTVAVNTPVYTPAPKPLSSPAASLPPKVTPSGSLPPPKVTPAVSGSVPPKYIPGSSGIANVTSVSATGSMPSSYMVPYTGGAEKVAVGAGSLFAALIVVFAF